MIDAYSFGRIVVDGTTYTSDIIVFPDHVNARWWRKQGHSLCLEDLGEVLDCSPDVFVIGQGSSGLVVVPPQLRQHLEALGMELFVADTQRAVAHYNQLCTQAGSSRKVVGAFHLTC